MDGKLARVDVVEREGSVLKEFLRLDYRKLAAQLCDIPYPHFHASLAQNAIDHEGREEHARLWPQPN